MEMKQEKRGIWQDIKQMRIGLNQGLTPPDSGVAGCCGTNRLLRRVLKTLRSDLVLKFHINKKVRRNSFDSDVIPM
jgi:hypothetical protein